MENTELDWLEGAWVSFTEYRDERNFEMAKAVMEDTKDRGCDSAATVMRFELIKAQKGHLCSY